MSTDFAKTLRAARQTAHQSQAQAAREIGCTLSALTKWEQGLRTPTGLYSLAALKYLRRHSVADHYTPRSPRT